MVIDVEREAEWLLTRAGFTTADAPGAYAIAVGCLGDGCLAKVPSHVLRRSHGELAKVHGRYRIYVSAAVSPARKAYVVLHELAHWRLIQLGYHGADVEALCDAISAALLVPRAPLLDAVAQHGPTWPAISADFAASQTICVLRYGEVTGVPVAVVGSGAVRIRGRSHDWPDTPAGFRALARAPVPPVRADRLTDNRRRTALVAAAA